MEREDVWKAIALYLADCHAANAGYDALLSSVSKSRRKRYADICKTAADLLEWKGTVPQANNRTLEMVVARLRKNVEECEKKDGKTAST